MQERGEQRRQKGEHKERGVFPGCVSRAWVKQLFAIKSFPLIRLASPLGIALTVNCQLCRKWSVVETWLLAGVECCTDGAVLRPDTALHLPRLLSRGEELIRLRGPS